MSGLVGFPIMLDTERCKSEYYGRWMLSGRFLVCSTNIWFPGISVEERYSSGNRDAGGIETRSSRLLQVDGVQLSFR